MIPFDGSASVPAALNDADQALLTLLRRLAEQDYAFVTPTPETHRRNLARREDQRARDLRDVFGWNLPFGSVPGAEIIDLLRRADAVEQTPKGERSAVRVASVGERLFLHSSFPTEAEDAVFFGPDSYRFAALIERELAGHCPRRIVDVGAGSGVGGILAADLCPAASVVLTDVNERALALARLNAAAAGIEAKIVHGDGVEPVEGGFDLALLNPPYIADDGERTYRDGGDLHGAKLAIDLSRTIVERLDPGGRMILYTGSAIVGGRDRQREELAAIPGCTLDYRELDPDVFGEELEKPAYADVERIAVVAAILTKRS